MGEVPGTQTGGTHTQLRISVPWEPCRVLGWVNPWILQGICPKSQASQLSQTGQGIDEEGAARGLVFLGVLTFLRPGFKPRLFHFLVSVPEKGA